MTMTNDSAPLIEAARFSFDKMSSDVDVLEMAFRTRQVRGSEPHLHVTTLRDPVAVEHILPGDVVVERTVTTDTMVAALGRSPRGSILLRSSPMSTIVKACAAERDTARALVEDLVDRVSTTTQLDTVSVRAWHLDGDRRPVHDERRLTVPAWADIADHYPARVRSTLDTLMATVRPSPGSKLIIWHGPSGTGKTTALRALLREWAPWCSGQYIADPERFFAETGYIMRVLTQPMPSGRGPTLSRAGVPDSRWRLIVAEDSDEHLRTTARRDAGAALGRLLNLSDGILGQGHDTLVLLTTNEPLSRLHPALTRPGRCLATVEFDRFAPQEASRKLPTGVPIPADGLTLAELLEARGELLRIAPVQDDEPIGQYL